MAGRNIDNHVPDPPFRYSLQVFADRIDVDPRDKLSAGFQHRPCLIHKLLKVAPCSLRLESRRAEPWCALRSVPGSRDLRR